MYNLFIATDSNLYSCNESIYLHLQFCILSSPLVNVKMHNIPMQATYKSSKYLFHAKTIITLIPQSVRNYFFLCKIYNLLNNSIINILLCKSGSSVENECKNYKTASINKPRFPLRISNNFHGNLYTTLFL